MIITRSFPGFGITCARNIVFAIPTNIFIHYYPNTSPFEKFIYGASGGLIGAVISQPLDFVKTECHRFNGEKQYVFELIKYHLKTNPRVFWIGGSMRALFGFCNMGIGSVSFHFFKENFFT